ncbi:MAG: hypothetical protein H0X15_11510 [Acidobacteria bacterium]|nr:hypothetical protein [Acidobacteriota bacterium]MBA3786138.1 hypothetical protein [Acidobacteriota bacterium]MBA4124693.1 hypothetical protein [Acidobacteriota bacterium]MBA4183434.1 hypothetical protein [Acidobacteriota bacterium]
MNRTFRNRQIVNSQTIFNRFKLVGRRLTTNELVYVSAWWLPALTSMQTRMSGAGLTRRNKKR